jgi:hypothetical protein
MMCLSALSTRQICLSSLSLASQEILKGKDRQSYFSLVFQIIILFFLIEKVEKLFMLVKKFMVVCLSFIFYFFHSLL